MALALPVPKGGRPRKVETVLVAIRKFDKMHDKSRFLASLTDDERRQIRAIVERLMEETDSAWTLTEYQQYGTMAWFLDRWDAETKGVDTLKIDPRALDAVMRYRKTLIDAVQSVRSARPKSDFFDRLKSFALEASKESATLKIEYTTKEKKEKRERVPVLDVEPIEVDDASDGEENQRRPRDGDA